MADSRGCGESSGNKASKDKPTVHGSTEIWFDDKKVRLYNLLTLLLKGHMTAVGDRTIRLVSECSQRVVR